jgi:hypothetical protein
MNTVRDWQTSNVLEGDIVVTGRLHHLQDRVSSAVETAFERSVSASQMPWVLDALAQSGKEASWVVFMFYTTLSNPETPDMCINLQYSIEAGRLGLDWVLLGPRNVAERDCVARFAKRSGFQPSLVTMNGVSYLRIEGGALSGLGTAIAAHLFGIDSDSVLGLLVHGFTLPPVYPGTH